MPTLIPNLEEALVLVQRATRTILQAYEANNRKPSVSVTLEQLCDSIDQMMRFALRLERETIGSTPTAEEISHLGDRGLMLLDDLLDWSTRLLTEDASRNLETAALVIAQWVLQHQGELRRLDLIATACMHVVGGARSPGVLEYFAAFIGRMAEATAHIIRQDPDKTNPNRPWRLLHLYRGIAAVRSHNPRLMEEIFEDLSRQLPEDAPGFFAEIMQQTTSQPCPEATRAIVGRYFDRWARPRMH